MSQETSIETDIAEIRRLDSLRTEVQTHIEKGLRGLLQKNYEEFGKLREKDEWLPPGDLVEKALVRGAVGEEFDPFVPKKLKTEKKGLPRFP